MRNIWGFIIVIFFVNFLFSCIEEEYDLKETIIENQEILREKKFFLINDFERNQNINNFDFNYINKLKSFNNHENFVDKLSDRKGLPQWSFAKRIVNANTAKGGGVEEDFIIIPMKEEDQENLSSLLYIKNPDDAFPQVYTVTNDQLFTFVNNNEIEKYDRESILMSFLYFDQKIFGDMRKYTNIPLDLFDNIPEAGTSTEHNHQNQPEAGFGYKEFNFNITEEGEHGKVAIICVDFINCQGCSGTCDLCPLCVSTYCWTIGSGGGYSSGGNYGNGGGNDDPPGGGSGGTGGSNNNYPWYTYYPDYYDYHPKLQILLDRLHQYNLHLDTFNEIPFLNSQLKTKFFNQFMFPLDADESHAKFIHKSIIFLCQNKDVVVEPENFMDRLYSLEQYLYDNPFAISDIPCNQIPHWQEVAQHPVPQSAKIKLQSIYSGRGNPYFGWALQNIEDAGGSLVNNDYFAVTFNTMPNKPYPHQNEQFTPDEFLNFVRKNINDFVDTSYSSFSPSNQTGFNEGVIWYSNYPMNSVIHINIPFNDGSVITTGYQINYFPFPFDGDFSDGHWIFTTIKTPYDDWIQGLDGTHPVSGNRKFGLIKNQNGTYTIYTRGVDRVTNYLHSILPGQNLMFNKADNLWQSFQQGIKTYIQNNSYSNSVTINTPAKWRPKWNEVNKVLLGIEPQSSLGCP